MQLILWQFFIYYLLCEKSSVRVDIVEADMLSRKSINIYEKFNGIDHQYVPTFLGTLASVRMLKGNYDDEVTDLFERCLAIIQKRDGNDSETRGFANINLFRHFETMALKLSVGDSKRTEQLQVAITYCNEAIRTSKIIGGPSFSPSHMLTLQYEQHLAGLLSRTNS